MPEIQVPDVARKLARFFGIDGSSPAPTLAPEIVSVALVADLTDVDVEDSGYERPCTGAGQVAAGAGTRSNVQLYNPENSGVIVTVEAAIVSLTSANVFSLRNYDTELSTVSTSNGLRDRRLGGGPGCPCSHRTDGFGWQPDYDRPRDPERPDLDSDRNGAPREEGHHVHAIGGQCRPRGDLLLDRARLPPRRVIWPHSLICNLG